MTPEESANIQMTLAQLPEEVLEFLLGALKAKEQKQQKHESTKATDAPS